MSGRFSFFLPAGRGLLGAPECRAWAADSRRAQLPGAANYRRWVGKPLDTLSPRSWPATVVDPERSWVEKPLDTLPPRCSRVAFLSPERSWVEKPLFHLAES